MSNEVYTRYKLALLTGSSNADLDGTEGTNGVYCALVDSSYSYSASHQFYDDITGIVGSTQEILNKTQGSGIFNGDDISFPSVTGNTVEGLVLYRRNSGASSTWRLVAFIDSGVTNLPAVPDGNNIDIVWDAAGIFAL